MRWRCTYCLLDADHPLRVVRPHGATWVRRSPGPFDGAVPDSSRFGEKLWATGTSGNMAVMIRSHLVRVIA